MNIGWLLLGLVRRLLCPALLVVAVALVPGSVASASVSPRIIGGTDASPGEFTYQVLLDSNGHRCGGSIVDSRHVITAAHCVEDDLFFNPPINYPEILLPATITVFYGGVDRGDPGDLTPVQVDHVSVDPRRQRRLGFDEFDSAVLTLSDTLPLASDPNTKAIPLATKDQLNAAFSAMTANRPWITGWGEIDDGSDPEILQKAQVPLVHDANCDDQYAPDFTPSVMLCAGTGTTDTCFGDSGGPLAVDIDPSPARSLRLAGITSFGPDPCAVAGFPGVYTEVPEDGTTHFLTSNPPAPPGVLGVPHATGTARVGSTVTCVPPPLPGGVVINQYLWYAGSGGNFTQFSPGAGASVVLPAATQGLTVGCDVRVENNGGYRYLEFVSTIGPVGAALTPTVPPPPADTTKPRVRVQKVRCKRRRCRITIKATDPGGLVKRVRARVRGKYKKCRPVGGRRRCTTKRVNKRLRLRKLKGGIYRGRIKLRRGRYAAYAVATDAAGNRSRRARKKFRVR
jgi:trypsin